MDTGASLHMMSKNAGTPGEKGKHQKIGGPHRHHDRQRKGRVDGRSDSVQYNDLDVFVTVMLLEDSPAVLSLDLLCEDMDNSYEWNK